MIFDEKSLAFLLSIATILTAGLGVYTFLVARGRPGVKSYILLAFASAIYACGYAFELSSGTLEQIVFWLKIEYIGIPVIPILCLLMCIGYVGYTHPYLTRIMVGVFLIPVCTYILFYTNEFHHLFYRSISLDTSGPFPVLHLVKGPWYWVHITYSYCSILVGVILLGDVWFKSVFHYRMQIMSMSAGMLIPLWGNQMYLTGNTPWGVDLAPIMMSIASPLHAWALLSFQLFNIGPVARKKVFENLQDGVIVLDEADRIVDFNPAAKQVLTSLNPRSIGVSVQEVLKDYPELIRDLLAEGNEFDLKIGDGSKSRYYHLRLSPMVEKEHMIGQIVTFNDITERVVLNYKLRTLATFDGLTNIYNRAHFMEVTNQTIEAIKQGNGAVTLIMMDIDHFKLINDRYGHDSGDRVIQQVAVVCRESIRDSDMLGRYGGEEFVFCLPRLTPAQGKEIAERIRLKLLQKPITLLNGTIQVTASFGVSGRDWLSDEVSMGSLLREADMALYEAKENGRNRVEEFTILQFANTQ